MTDDTNNLDLKELYGEFVDESQELLEDIARELVELEKSPSDGELIDKIFRALHTLKGNSGFIGLHDLSDIAHNMENVLGKLREKEMDFFAAINTVLFKGLDVSKSILIDFIESRESEHDYSALKGELVALLDGPKEGTLRPGEKERTSSDRRQAEERRVVAETTTESAFMRVATTRLDKLVNLAGELAAGRSRLLQLKGELNSKAFDDVASFIATISAQLQSEVLSIRMVPIKQLFNKFFRLVRDISFPLGKDVELRLVGEDTELDKTIIEVLHDPLLHMIRNSIAHGIETSAERRKAGKPETSILTLSAFHEHNSIVIDIEDDGRGLDIAAIKAKALQRGIIDAEEESELTDDDIAHLIFLSGFSTAEQIDDLSGRGVGMDVVKTNIERLGGSIDLDFEAGLGTKFTMKMPLTLAIVQLFLLAEGGYNYGIPLGYVEETLRVPLKNIESIKGQMIYMLRHEAIPLVSLSELLGLGVRTPENDYHSVVLVGQQKKKVGFIVDDFLGKVETVIKPLGKYIESLPDEVEGISGASILGSGEIVVVLDIPALFRLLEDFDGAQEV